MSLILKKNIVLIPADYNGVSNQKGVLSLNILQDKIECNLRCYNIKQTDETFKVGVMVNDNIFKTTANAKDLTNLKLQINCLANNSSKISCVIVALNNNSYETILWGSTETTKAMQNHILIQKLLETTNILEKREVESLKLKKEQQIEEKQQEIFEDEMLESYIDKVVLETEPNNVKQDFKQTVLEDETTSEITFYEQVKKQVDKLFSENEVEETLSKIIPDGKFCKVKSEDGYYVFGIIYENQMVKCLCYGVPQERYGIVPKELDGFSQWLPLSTENPDGKGYWITYQDAKTGENIQVEMI